MGLKEIVDLVAAGGPATVAGLCLIYAHLERKRATEANERSRELEDTLLELSTAQTSTLVDLSTSHVKAATKIAERLSSIQKIAERGLGRKRSNSNEPEDF